MVKKEVGIGFVTGVGLSILLGVVFLATKASRTSYQINLPSQDHCQCGTESTLAAWAQTRSADGSEAVFPYRAYLESAPYCDPFRLQRDLRVLDSIFPDRERENRRLLIVALTDSLEKQIGPTFEAYQPDSLLALAQWVTRLEPFTRSGPEENRVVYGVVFDHWMNALANRLAGHYREKNSRKYDFQFNYLLSTLRSYRYYPSVGKPLYEKAVDYLVESKFGYIFNRFCGGTTLWFQIVFGLFGVFFLLSAFYTLYSFGYTLLKFFQR